MGASDVFPDYIVALLLLVSGCVVWLAVIMLIVYAITRSIYPDEIGTGLGYTDDDD